MALPRSDGCPGLRDDASWTGRAFVVQLSLDAAPAAGLFCGRVQHLRSGDAAHFESLDELATFMRLRTVEPSSGEAAAEERGGLS